MTPRLEHICDITVELARPHEFGECPHGTRRVIPIIGGTVNGSRISGRILDVGADWQTVSRGGIAELDARYVMETDDGAVIEVISRGIRDASPEVAARIARGEPVDPSEYYMRTAIWLVTGDPEYAWINRALFLASGSKAGSAVRLSVYRVG